MNLFRNKIFLLIILSLILLVTPLPACKFVGFFIFLFFTARVWQDYFFEIFQKKFSSHLYFTLGLFTVFSLVGLVSSIFVVYYSLNSSLVIYPFVITALITSVFCYRGFRSKVEIENISFFQESSLAKVLLAVFVLLFSFGLFILNENISSIILFSPWQAIPFVYLFIFFILSVVISILLYVLKNNKIALVVLIALSFFVHAYLPMSHVLPWGGDVWRHMAIEQRMIDGGLELPVLFGKETLTRNILGISMPEVFLIPNKYSYGHLWGTSIVLSEVLHVDLLQINKWLVPVLWSLFFPIFLYLLGIILFDSRRKSLWLVFASTFIFSFQALGAFTLPVSFDFILFLFLLFLFLSYTKQKHKDLSKVLLLLIPLLLFQYSLFLLLSLFILLFYFLLEKMKFTKIRTLLISPSVLFIPFFELITKLAKLNSLSDVWLGSKQMIGHLSGITYAWAIRGGDILTGNIFFNHTPSASFVVNIFSIFRWHIPMLMLLVWILFFLGIFYIYLNEDKLEWQIITFLSFLVVGGYVYGWVFFSGDHLFVRRLDPMFALIVLFVVFYSVFNIKIINKIFNKKIVSFLLVALVILFGTTSYSSGPDMVAASTDQYKTSQYVFDIIKDDSKFCVIGDPMQLLTLEYVSKKKIVGGGFPIDRQFAQPELSSIYRALLDSSFDLSMMDKAFAVTDSSRCFLVVSKNIIDIEKKHRLDYKLAGYDLEGFPVYVWMVEKNH